MWPLITAPMVKPPKPLTVWQRLMHRVRGEPMTDPEPEETTQRIRRLDNAAEVQAIIDRFLEGKPKRGN